MSVGLLLLALIETFRLRYVFLLLAIAFVTLCAVCGRSASAG